MSTSLAELEPLLLEKVLELESTNMIPVLSAIGIHLNREDIRNEILKDPTQRILLVIERDQVGAVLRYSREETGVFVKSIQLNKAFPQMGLMRFLLAECLKALQSESLFRIESVAQISNPTSISFHEKLGFLRVKENSKSIRFGIDRPELEKRLRKILRR